MAFTDRIKLIIDVATDGARSGLQGLRGDLDQADGAFNKTRTVGGNAFDMIKNNAGAMALGAGAAVVGFGVKAVGAFQETALAAGKLSEASGLTVQDASRWLDAADQYGVSGDDMAKAFNKMNQALADGSPTLAAHGIAVQKNKDGQVDANATMLKAIDVIKGIQDPVEKAQVAQDTFGKGWMQMGELIEVGSKKISAGMAEVSDQQVIDPEELAKAREFRDNLDDLQDAFRNVFLEVGEGLVPALSDLMPLFKTLGDGLVIGVKGLGAVAKAFDTVTEAAYDLGGGLGQVIFGTGDEVDYLHDATRAADEHFASLSNGIQTMAGFTAALDKANIVGTERALLINKFVELYPEESAQVKELTRVQAASAEVARGLAGATDEVTESSVEAAKRLKEHHDRVMDLKSAYAALTDELAVEDDFLAADQMWADLQDSAVAAYDAAATGADDAEQKQRDHAVAVNDAKQQVIELGEKYTDLPASVVTDIIAMIDEGKLAEAEARFNNLARNRTMQVSIQAHGGSGHFTIGGSFAEGGTVPGRKGEPQLILAHGGEEVISNQDMDAARRGGGARARLGAGGDTFVTVIDGNVYGVEHLNRVMDERDRKLAARLKAGRR